MEPTIFESRRPSEEVIDASLSETKLACYWIDVTRASAPEHAPISADLFVDDVVVGGGLAGLWTATKLKLEHPERTVALIEAVRIGWAAAGRNGGVCSASLAPREDGVASRWPRESGTLRRLGYDNLDAIESFVSAHELDVEWERNGALSIANEPYQVMRLGERSDPLVEILDRDATRARINSPTFLGAEFSPNEAATLHPAKLTLELARYAREIGVEIFEHSPVRRMRGGQFAPLQLETKAGTITAERAALCTSAFPSLLARYRLHTVPVYDVVLMSEPLTEAQLASIGWQGREAIADAANQPHYARLTRDHRILWGGSEAVYVTGGKLRPEHEDREDRHRALASHFFTTFPQLAGVRFSHRWAGANDMSTRTSAFFGEAYGGKVQYVSGFSGAGLGAAHFAADVMVDRLEQRVTERTELGMVREVPLPYPPEPAASIAIHAAQRELRQADHRRGERSGLLKTLRTIGQARDA